MGIGLTTGVTFILVVVGAAWFAGQQPKHVLDLSKVATPASSDGGRSCTVATPAQVSPKFPLTVSLSLNGGSFFLGGHVVYDVTIHNNGNEKIALPWIPRASFLTSLRDEDPSNRVMSLELVTRDDRDREHMLMAAMLYGNDSLNDSFRTIDPGESARIRVPGWLTIAPEDASRIAAPDGKEREFFAKVRISPQRCVWADAIVSPPVPVVLRVNPPTPKGS